MAQPSFPNKSPWLDELNSNREVHTLDRDVSADIAVVGAGIAGMSTAYFLLKHTNMSVLVVEANTLASGASGHNAGMVLTAFERPFTELAEEFGQEQARSAHKEIEAAWTLLDEIVTETKGRPIERVTGYGGLRTLEDVVTEARDVVLHRFLGFNPSSVLVADNAPFLESIPQECAAACKVVPQEEILRLIHSEAPYYAALPQQFGVANSALVCEHILLYLQHTFADRFQLFENTTVQSVTVDKEETRLLCEPHTIRSRRTVLCSNGFENLTIVDTDGHDIDSDFHGLVSGKVGYMQAYLTQDTEVGAYFYDVDEDSLSLSPSEEGFKEIEAFLYISKRPWETGGKKHGLMSVGGTETQLPDRGVYEASAPYPNTARMKLESVFQQTCNFSLEEDGPLYSWHGLMGYTPDGVRRVGMVPNHPALFYNLGCNGIGILTSVMGGRRIARLVSGEELPPSIFDPR